MITMNNPPNQLSGLDAAPRVYFTGDLEKKSPNKLMRWQKRTFVVSPGTLQYYKPGKPEAAGTLQKSELTKLQVDTSKKIALLYTKTDRGIYELRCENVARLRAFQKAMFNAFPKLQRERSSTVSSCVMSQMTSNSSVCIGTSNALSPTSTTRSLPPMAFSQTPSGSGSIDEMHSSELTSMPSKDTWRRELTGTSEENGIQHGQHSRTNSYESGIQFQNAVPRSLQREGTIDNMSNGQKEAEKDDSGRMIEYFDERTHRRLIKTASQALGARFDGVQRVKYEGEGVNGKRHGHGIEYDEDGKKIFEGYWYEGIRQEGTCFKNGQEWLEGTWDSDQIVLGREYNLMGKIKYEGQWEEDLWHGMGTCYFEDGKKRYEGTWQNGEWHGDGVLYYQQSDDSNEAKVLYRGQFEVGECSGAGTCYLEKNSAKRYSGQWLEGDRHGVGHLYNDNGLVIYKGQWCKNMENGQGEVFSENGKRIFKGTFKNGDRVDGTAYKEDGAICYEGNWSGLCRNGRGKEYSCGNVIYDGNWEYNERHGSGDEYDESGWKIYSGQWVSGKSGGYGLAYYETGEVLYEGYWSDGKRHGSGVEFDVDGKVIREGIWMEGHAPELLPLRKRDVARNKFIEIVNTVRNSLKLESPTSREHKDSSSGPRRNRRVSGKRNRLRSCIANSWDRARDCWG